MSAYLKRRVTIYVKDGVLRHSNQKKPLRVTVGKDAVRVGCTQLTREAVNVLAKLCSSPLARLEPK